MTRSVEDFDTDWNKIADGVFYKLQTTQDDRLRFRWTDLVHVFEEDITTLEISNRFQKLNLSLTMPAREIIKEVENLLSEVPPSKIDNDTGSMRFQRSIEELGTLLIWEFHPKKLNAEKFYSLVFREVATTLAKSIAHIRNMELTLKMKDKELQDLYDSGGKLTQSSLKTEKFEEPTKIDHCDLKEVLSNDIYKAMSKMCSDNVAKNEVLNEPHHNPKDTNYKRVVEIRQKANTKHSSSVNPMTIKRDLLSLSSTNSRKKLKRF